jgi:sphingolipid delta-4 desaturase
MILAILLVSINLSLAYVLKVVYLNIYKDSSWPVLLTIVYVFGATINHTLHILIHDFTHWSGH